MKAHLIQQSSWAVFLLLAMLLPTSAFSQYRGEPVALFVNDRTDPPPEVLAKAKQIELRDGVLSVRIVSIGDSRDLIQQKSLLVDLEGQSLPFRFTSFRTMGSGETERKVWSGNSDSGYKLDLMVRTYANEWFRATEPRKEKPVLRML